MSSIRRIILAIFLFSGLFGASDAFAQTAEQDSLLSLISSVQSDTVKARLLTDLSRTYRRADWRKQYEYSSKALDILRGSREQDLLLSALYLLGNSCLYREEHSDSSLVFFEQGLSLAREGGNLEKETTFLLSIGSFYHQTGVYDKAFEYYEQGISIAEREELKELHCRLLNNVGLILMREEDYDKALSFFDQAFGIAEELGNKRYMSAMLSNTGIIHGVRKEYDQALDKYNQALELKRSSNDQMGATITICNIGNLYRRKGMYEQASARQSEGLALATDLDYARGRSICLEGLTYTHLDWEKYALAIQYGQEGLAISEKTNLLENQVDFKEALAASYAGIGDYSRAYEEQLAFRRLRDSMLSLQKLRQINELEAQYQLRQKETENQLIKEKQIYQEDSLRKSNTLIAVVIALLLMAILLAINYYRSSRRKQQYNEQLQVAVADRTAELNHSVEELRQTNQELEEFAFIASHDLKEPLRNIISFNNLIQKKIDPQVSSEVKEYFTFVNSSGKQMYNLIESTLEFSRLSKAEDYYDSTDVNEVIKQVEQKLQQLIQQKGAVITTDNLPVIHGNPEHLFQMFKNLVENGIKYNDQPNPQVHITYLLDTDHQFTIHDNGIGISPEYHDTVFGMFKRLHSRKNSGPGLGLAIVHKLVQRLGGTISLDSELNQGSTFVVRLPVHERSAS